MDPRDLDEEMSKYDGAEDFPTFVLDVCESNHKEKNLFLSLEFEIFSYECQISLT